LVEAFGFLFAIFLPAMMTLSSFPTLYVTTSSKAKSMIFTNRLLRSRRKEISGKRWMEGKGMEQRG
jgi:hypothetical protein